MTLLETLLATAVAVLVVAAVYSLYHAVGSALRAQRALRGPEAAARALRDLARDIECAFAAVPDPACAFVLEPGPDGNSRLGFCTAILPEGETDLRWAEIHQVAWRIAPEEARPVLVREHRPLAGPGSDAAVTNAAAGDVSRFRVSVLAGTEWKDEWAQAGADACPRAAKVELRCGGKDFRADVFIPAGNVVTSSIVRAAGPAAAAASPGGP